MARVIVADSGQKMAMHNGSKFSWLAGALLRQQQGQAAEATLSSACAINAL